MYGEKHLVTVGSIAIDITSLQESILAENRIEIDGIISLDPN